MGLAGRRFPRRTPRALQPRKNQARSDQTLKLYLDFRLSIRSRVRISPRLKNACSFFSGGTWETWATEIVVECPRC
jgi:hypothetical protein